MKTIIKILETILFVQVFAFAGFAQTISDPSYTPYGGNPNLTMPLGKSTTSNFTNIQILSSSYHQTETSTTIDPNNSNNLFVGANTVLTSSNIRIGGYYSTSGINNWGGTDELSGEKRFDPSVSYNLNGNLFYAYNLNNNGNYDTYVLKSTDKGVSWGTSVKITSPNGAADKCFIAIDKNINSLYKNNIYILWTENVNNNTFKKIYFAKSTNLGQSYSTPMSISGAQLAHSAVCSVDNNGTIYVTWAIVSAPETTGIGFCKSTDGGNTFTSPTQIYNVSQIGALVTQDNDTRYRLKITSSNPRGIRVDSYPSMSVDPNNGVLYIVWADNRFGNADIVIIKSTNGGSSWSSTPLKVNDDDTNTDQWFPWINVGDDGGVNIVFYDSRNDPTNNLLTEVYVARSTDQGQTFMNYKVSNMQFTPLPVPNLASGYMGDYIGITSENNKVYPVWMDNRTSNYQIYTAEMILKPVVAQYTVDQKLDNGTRVGVVSRWDGATFGSGYAPPKVFSFDIGSTQVLKGDQRILSNEKYNNWDNDADVTNHHSFIIDANKTTFTSNFNSTNPGVTIQNSLESTSVNTGSIGFKDPWLIDYADTNYGNNLRNQGMNAPFKTRSSPFYPDFSTSYGTDVYKGVFLNQNPSFDPKLPNYSVSALLTQTINGFTSYFQNWSGTNVQFQDSNAQQTGVVFTSDSAVVKANYKAHLGTGSPILSDTKNQYRFLTNGIWYIMCYESMGDIWLTSSGDGGTNWYKEERLNTNIGNAKNPSFSNIYTYNNNYYGVITWIETNQSGSTEMHLQTFQIPQGGPYPHPVLYGWSSASGGERSSSNHLTTLELADNLTPRADARPVVQIKDNGSGSVYIYYAKETNGSGVSWNWCFINISQNQDLSTAALSPFPVQISTSTGDIDPVIIYYPSAYGYPSRLDLFYLGAGYSPDGLRVVRYNGDNGTKQTLPKAYQEKTYSSLQGAVNPLMASYALVSGYVGYSGEKATVYYIKHTYDGSNPPSVSTLYSNLYQPALQAENYNGFGGPTADIWMQDASSTWYLASNGSQTLTSAGINIA